MFIVQCAVLPGDRHLTSIHPHLTEWNPKWSTPIKKISASSGVESSWAFFFSFHCCLMCNKNDWLFLFPCAICRKSPRLWLALSNFWTHLFCFFTFLLMLSVALNFLSRFPSRYLCLFAWRLLCFMRLRRARLMCDSWFVDFPSLLEFAATSLNSFCRLMCIFGFLFNLVCCFPHPPFLCCQWD